MFVQEWTLIPTAKAVAAAKVKTKFKKSKMNKAIGQVRTDKKFAANP